MISSEENVVLFSNPFNDQFNDHPGHGTKNAGYVTLLHIYVFIGLLKHNMNTCMKVPMFIYSIV